MLDLSTTTPLFCEKTPDLATTTYCYYPSENYLYFLDVSNAILYIFLGAVVFFLVAIFIKKLFEKI